jgi:type II secretory pathway pseudopilin PulG
MIRPHNILKTRDGFTIIEIILLIILSALFGTMLFQFTGTSVTRSGEEVVLVQDGCELTGIMEQMAADYDELVKTDPDSFSLDDFRTTNIEAGNTEGNDPYYGDYTVSAVYIQFNEVTRIEEPPDENNLLKVTIIKGSQSLTALFSKKTGG